MRADPEKKSERLLQCIKLGASVSMYNSCKCNINVNIVLLGNKACHTNVRAGCKYTSSKKVNETR